MMSLVDKRTASLDNKRRNSVSTRSARRRYCRGLNPEKEIMVKRSIWAVLLTMLGLVSVTAVGAQSGSEQGHWGVIQANCVSCHNSTAKVGGLALDTLSPGRIAEDAQIWE